VSAPLRRYAYAQARVRARLARLLGSAQLATLAAYPDVPALHQELAALGWEDPLEAVLEAFDAVLRVLDEAPRRVVHAYRARYEAENLKLLLRALERGTSYTELAPLLLPVGALRPGPPAEALLRSPSLAEAVARLEPWPFGDVLRQQVRAQRGAAPDRFRLELAAERAVYEAAWAALAALEPPDRRGARRILGTKLDGVNLLRAARMRLHSDLSAEEVLAYLVRGGLYFRAAERAVLAHEPVDQWASRLAETPFASALTAGWNGIEAALGRILAREASRALSGPPFQLALPLAYLVLVELQAGDLERLVAAKQMRRSEAWLRAGLVAGRGA
jgi:vacuolar-type H+-ATPase subunit C/Vma6